VAGRNDQVSEWVDVHFNPASLQLQVSNELKDTRNNERKQYVAKANAKLSMELQFDTTDTGDDVTLTTKKLQAFIAPPLSQQNRSQIPPPVVLFEWGRLKFKGIAETYRETIDFFSSSGVPLRASVNLTLSRQDQVFDEQPGDTPADAGGVAGDETEVGAPATGGAPESEGFTPRFRPPSAADVAGMADSPEAARALAAANGQENLRFGDGSPFTVSASIQLKPPSAFVDLSLGAGIGAGAGLGLDLGIGGGIGIGAGGGIGIGVGVSGGIGIGGGISAGVSGGLGFGASVSAGAGIGFSAGVSAGVGISAGTGVSAGISGLSRLSATEGAFAGLRVTAKAGASTARINTSRLLPPVRSTALSTDANATFRVGGKATMQGAAGLRADVGARGGVRGKLTFESL
jgi:hypothetical protein